MNVTCACCGLPLPTKAAAVCSDGCRTEMIGLLEQCISLTAYGQGQPGVAAEMRDSIERYQGLPVVRPTDLMIAAAQRAGKGHFYGDDAKPAGLPAAD